MISRVFFLWAVSCLNKVHTEDVFNEASNLFKFLKNEKRHSEERAVLTIKSTCETKLKTFSDEFVKISSCSSEVSLNDPKLHTWLVFLHLQSVQNLID